jgi:hypothetical protein
VPEENHRKCNLNRKCPNRSSESRYVASFMDSVHLKKQRIFQVLQITFIILLELPIYDAHGEFLLTNVRFEVFTPVTMKNGVFWDVMPCGSYKNRRF